MVTGHKAMEMEGSEGDDPGNVLADFIKQYYSPENSNTIPDKILTSQSMFDRANIQEWMSAQRGKLVSIITPSRGKNRKLLDLVQTNADEAQRIGLRSQRSRHSTDAAVSLAKLQEYLSLPDIPNRIECYDGSNIQGSNPVEVLLELGLTSIQLTSLAKQEELLFQPNVAEPIRIPSNDSALFLVQRLRDEAHRFAITHHRTLRSKAAVRSQLSTIPGIGPKRERALLRKFGSLKQLQAAPDEAIMMVPGLTPNIVHSIRML